MKMASKSDREVTIEKWLAATDALDKAKHLAFFTEDAVLDDPSVGRKFEGRAEIGKYFDEYFTGYKTRTRLVSIAPKDGRFHVEVLFTGDFPGGKIGGFFDVTFRDDKISLVRAGLSE